MNKFNIELDSKFTRSLSPPLTSYKPYRGQVSDKYFADLFSWTFIQYCSFNWYPHFFHLLVVLRYMRSFLTLLINGKYRKSKEIATDSNYLYRQYHYL